MQCNWNSRESTMIGRKYSVSRYLNFVITFPSDTAMSIKSNSAWSLILIGSVISSCGCRVQLPVYTSSNLWARSVEDRADWHLTQQGQGVNPTHIKREMSDWTKGFYQGYHAGAFTANGLPQSNYPAVWSNDRYQCCLDEQQRLAGYQAGYGQAMVDGPINVAIKSK